ncbi:MAG: hypothetical protein DESF_00890 [Desulfovibrio sp.]
MLSLYRMMIVAMALAVYFIGNPMQLYATGLLSDGEKEAFWYDGKWAHEHSDLPPDPSIVFGRLSNGFRYAVIPNANHNGRVSLYLDVQAGSLMEKDDELGYAHYVEHMAFNGTRNFPPGSLIPFFQKHGMSFGGDTNAHTGWVETVYKLNLAGADRESLSMGLTILRDFADGMLFDPTEVEEERGVILAEKNKRDSEAMQSRRQRTAEMYAGTAFVNQPIGTEAGIMSATSERLAAFYHKWYHPERMILVAVGAVSAPEVEALAKKIFGDMKNPGPAPSPEQWGSPKLDGVKVISQQRAISGEEVSVTLQFPRVHARDTRQKQLEQLVDAVVEYCMQRRLLERDQRDALWNSGRFVNRWRQGFLPSGTLAVETHATGWRDALEAMAEEIRLADRHGFTAQEIARALEALEKTFARRAAQRSGMSNTDVADEFVRTANADFVQTSSVFDQKLFQQLRREVTPEAVNAVARTVLGGENVTLVVGAAVPPTQKEILQAWQDGKGRELERVALRESAPFPYLPLPPALSTGDLPRMESRLLSLPDEQEVRLYEGRLKGGAQLYILPLPFESGKAAVQILYGTGYAAGSDGEISLAQTAGAVMAEGGIGRLSRLDAQKIAETMGGAVKENFGVNGATVTVEGEARQLELLVQAAWVQFADPQPDAAGLQKARRKLEAQGRKKRETIEEVAKTDGQNFFYGGARRYRSLEAEEAARFSIEDVRDFVSASRRKGPLRVVISGDVNVQQSLALAARYFSSVTPVQEARAASAPSLVFPAGDVSLVKVPDAVDQTTLRKVWRLDFPPDGDRAVLAARQVAAAVLRDRLRRDLRERMGASYSPVAFYRTMPAENGYSLLQVEVATDNAQFEAVAAYLETLAPWEITGAELNRLRPPMLTRWKSGRASPQYWQRLLVSELVMGQPFLHWGNLGGTELEQVTPEAATAALREMLEAPCASWRAVSTGFEGKGTASPEESF